LPGAKIGEADMAGKETRVERDSMGPMDLPLEAYYGASTQRAVLNFPISDLRLQRALIRALALIKQAAAEVNKEFGDVDAKVADAIIRAAGEVAGGKFDNQFVVDVFQTGSGTSTNMNANEVIANLAIEILGGKRGDRNLVHPNDHVNWGMSSNDAIPTAIHIAALIEIREKLKPALQALAQSLNKKSAEFMPVIKTGRTHLQDATPIRLGQEFLGYAGQIENALTRLDHIEGRLASVALGGTAVGTGINTRADFAGKVLAKVSAQLGFKLSETTNHFQAQSTIDEIVDASGALKCIAVSLLKLANDIRWLGCGPRAGFAELALPEVQPGSSIMPGKVNPVIAEALCMVAAQVIGNDLTITIAGQSGNFELNVMLPVAAFNLIQSIEIMASAVDNFREKLVDGLRATEHGPELVERGLALCTALVPAIGYDAAAGIAHDAYLSGKTVRQVAREKTDIGEDELDKLLDPRRMTDREE
jgi:fumarate hydratase class II